MLNLNLIVSIILIITGLTLVILYILNNKNIVRQFTMIIPQNILRSREYKPLLLTDKQITEARAGYKRLDIKTLRYLQNINFLYSGQERFLSIYNDLNKLQEGDVAIFENYIFDANQQLIPPNPETTLANVIENAYKRGAKVRILHNTNILYLRPGDSPKIMNEICQRHAKENCHACDNRHSNTFGTLHSKTTVFFYKSTNTVVSYIGSGDFDSRYYDTTKFNDNLRSKNTFFSGWHDLFIRFTQPIAWDISNYIKMRLNDPSPTYSGLLVPYCEKMTPLKNIPNIQEPNDIISTSSCTAQIVRTISCLGATKDKYLKNIAPLGEYTCLYALRKILTEAKNFLFITDQFLMFKEVESLLTKAVNRITKNNGTVILLTNSPYGFSENIPKTNIPILTLTRLLANSRYELVKNIINNSNVGIFQMLMPGGSEQNPKDLIYLHEKVVLCDDELLLFGSCGFERIGFTNDLEISVFLQAPQNKFVNNDIYNLRIKDFSILLDEPIEKVINYQTPKEILNLFRETASNPKKFLKPLNVTDMPSIFNKTLYDQLSPDGRCKIQPITELY